MESNFFGKPSLKLLRKDGSLVSATEALKGAHFVLLYFSAHWCPPCREFTPLLKQFYEQHHETKKFEIVFMSLDNSEKEMLEYFKESHGDYFCLPYEESKATSWGWSKKHSFKTIPTLLVFDNANPHNLIAKCGRDMVAKDPNAESFPWTGADATQRTLPEGLEYLRWAILIASGLWLFYSFFFKKSEA